MRLEPGQKNVVIHPTLRVLYVTNSSNNTVSQYSIGNDGKLTPLSTPAVTAGSIPEDMKLDPSGKFAYVLNQNSNNIYQYNIDEASGALAYSSTTNISKTTGSLNSIAIEASGKYLYISASNDTIFQFTINLTTGALSPMTPASISIGGVYMMEIDPSGKYLYSIDVVNNCANQSSIGTTGLLSAMSPPSVQTGVFPKTIAIDPSNRFAYVLNYGDYTISQYAISSSGLLSAVNTFSLQAELQYWDTVIDYSGSYLYVVDNTGFIFLFNIDSSGALHASATPSIPVAEYARSIALLR